MALIEREHALACLRERFTRCDAGQGQVALVDGPVGIGRSALLTEFGQFAADSRATVLLGAGSPTERDLILGLLHDLVLQAPFDQTDRARVVNLLAYRGSGAAPDGTAVLGASALHELCALVSGLARRAPLVICVDDVQHVDDASVRALLYLARRIGSARVMLVLGERTEVHPSHPAIRTELADQPSWLRLTLRPLSAEGVGRIFAAASGGRVPAQVAAVGAELTGGSPTLVQALTTDWLNTGRTDANWLDTRQLGVGQLGGDGTAGRSDQVTGEAFRHSVIRLLDRGDPVQAKVARALAIVAGEPSMSGDAPAAFQRDRLTAPSMAPPPPPPSPSPSSPASPPRPPQQQVRVVAGLAEVPPEVAARAIDLLAAVGVLTRGGRFRHPATPAAVLAHPAVEHRDFMHARAAGLLQAEGFPAAVVARQVAAAGTAAPAWSVPVLRAAADQALAVGRPQTATGYLRLAHRLSSDPAAEHGAERAQIRAALARAQWLTDPAEADPYLAGLAGQVQRGDIDPVTAVVQVRYLLWYGRIAEATQVLAAAASLPVPVGSTYPEERQVTELLLAHLYPGHGQLEPEPSTSNGRAQQPTDDVWTILADAPLRGLTTLGYALAGRLDAGLLNGAEQLMQRYVSAGTGAGPAVCALTALLSAGALDAAAGWCDTLLAQPATRQVPTWHSLLDTVRAEISLRHGDVPAATTQARRALDRIPVDGWGVAIGAPLARLICAATAAGRYDDGARLLNVPVPRAMFLTPFGLGYLQARGRYRLATGQPSAALEDFESGQRLMRRWRLDNPVLAAWRLDVATAYLVLQRGDEARVLLEAELAGPLAAPVRGVALRLLAATRPVEERAALLRESVELLQSHGYRLELAHALADLGRVYHGSGDLSRARTTVRQAYQMAKACGAEALAHSLLPDVSRSLDENDVPAGTPGGGRGPGLSDAERRVVVLAAKGYSNRDIANTLYITISTVEQHLTRAYRKLNVRRRSDLLAGVLDPAVQLD